MKTTTQRVVPVPVAGGLRFRAVSTGNNHTCGMTVEDAAYCCDPAASSAMGPGRIG